MNSVLHLSKRLQEAPQIVSSNEFKVRTFADEDIDSLLKLRQVAFARERLGVRDWKRSDFMEEFVHRWWWRPDRMWLAETVSENGESQCLGAVTLAMRGEAVGHGQTSLARATQSPTASAKPVVHWLMVAPRWRRQGVGRALMAHLETAAWEDGHREIWLETHSAWEAAARFYERLGFCPTK